MENKKKSKKKVCNEDHETSSDSEDEEDVRTRSTKSKKQVCLSSSSSEEDVKRRYHSTSSDEDSNSDESQSSMESVMSNLKIQNKDGNYDILLRELMDKQLEDTPSQWKLGMNDMKRICGYIKTSIFNGNKCAIWNGYITNKDQVNNKGTYVNFFFNGKKVALHRLLHINFVYPLDDTWYLKFKCKNKGKCCNINHCEKYKYLKVGKKKKTSSNKKSIVISSSSSMKMNLDSDSE